VILYDFGMLSRWSNKSEKSFQLSFQDVPAVRLTLLLASGVPRAPPLSRTGSSGKRYKERRDKLRERIQGKKRDDGKRALQLAVSVARRC